MWQKIFAVVLISVFSSATAQAYWSNKYDPYCVSSLERRGAVEIAEVTIFNAEERILILKFEGSTVMLHDVPDELVDIITTELDRGFTPVGAVVMYAGLKWSSITTATFTNDDGMSLGCSTHYLLKMENGSYRDSL